MEHWEEHKKTYRSIQISEDALDIQWENIQHRLPKQEWHQYSYYFRYAGLFAGIMLLLCAGIVMASQKSQPGEALYSVKQLTNNLGLNKTQTSPTKIEKKQTPLIKKPTPTPTSVPETPPPSSVKIQQEVQGAHIENTHREDSPSATNQGYGQQNTNASNSNGNSPSNQSNNGNQGNGNSNKGKSDENHGNSDNSHANGSGNGNSGNNGNEKGNGSGKDK